MATLRFEGRRIPVRDGDSVASALYRAGIRTFTRSLKYHRRRGLYCLTGDCPNCLMVVDGEPAVRTCCRSAADGMRVAREGGFPSAEHDLLAVADRLHRLMPVGFYYKAFGKPRWLWPVAERVIRRATGLGSLPRDGGSSPLPARHVRADVLVIGAGLAGLAAAEAAAASSERVVIVDEGRPGAQVAPGPVRDRIDELASRVRTLSNVELWEEAAAIGLYEGPSVPVVGPGELREVEAGRVVVATGAVERHAVFAGNDLPGVWLARGAARMAGVHGVAPGARALVVAATVESAEHVRTLAAAGVEIAMVLAPSNVAALLPPGTAVVDGTVVRAEGRRALEGVVIRGHAGQRRIACDVLAIAAGRDPRDGLLRMGSDMSVTGAGDVISPGCTPEDAIASGARAGSGGEVVLAETTPASEGTSSGDDGVGPRGIVCLCEDVGVDELAQAWTEGFTNAETMKRYTTATMGPCQGAMCGRHLSAFVRGREGGTAAPNGRTTARPPVRPVKLEDLVGGVDEVIEKRTGLHDHHLAMGATVGRSGSWMRPYRYGDPAEEYRAVRERVSVMDVGTLGKFLIGGPDALALLDRTLPCRLDDLTEGRSRYFLALDDAGYAMDDGLVCALGAGRFAVTSTSGGADRMEAWLLDRADRWGLHAHVVNRTSSQGAINVAGPLARDLLLRVCDDAIDAAAFPAGAHREIDVGGIPCFAIRSGFVGELSYELHHPRSRGQELWEALMREGAPLGIAPHGLDALDVLRLEKGHVYLGQDTLPDDHPRKLGLEWTVAIDKPEFTGKLALQRMAGFPLERKLVGFRFDRDPQRGAPLLVEDRVTGRITSCARSPVLGMPIGLGWIRAIDGIFPQELRAGDVTATVVPTPFYDPEGARLRA